MLTFYLGCTIVGGVILVLQLLLTVTGLLGDMEADTGHDAEFGHDGMGDHGGPHGEGATTGSL